ncbi:MAG: anthranilate synthase, catalytic subunit [Chthonomonadales bacterium]|nr:anthranilate synthase, catalytic subunit [Chthonomonadales bacterium]
MALMVVPDREEFLARARRGNLVPVYREILADRLTPVSAFEKLTATEEPGSNGYSFLLESAEGGERMGRYSFLGSNPSLIFRSKGRRATLQEGGQIRELTIGPDEDPLTLVAALMARYTYVETPDLPRFCGGAVGFFGYDIVRFFEKLPDTNPDEVDVDDACLMFTDTLLIFDHVKHRVKVVCNAHITEDPEAAYADALLKIEALIARLRTPHPAALLTPPASEPAAVQVQSLFPRSEYEAAVERCREYILAGDAFQVVLSQRFKVPFTAPPFDLYRALRSVNPSPYMFYLDLGTRKVVGTSPEILVSVERGMARLRPIAGTRPRGATIEEDKQLEADLLADAKECAEHIMLVDLSRNDLGRVCEYGSVTVNELMIIERYSHVMHIVSDVTGRLRPDQNIYTMLRSCFPHGTVSGAPKVRAMEIIDEQEPTRRGLYAGALGYISYSGDMDVAITIRTMLVDEQTAYLQAGGGLVADSVPANEYQECVNKARALVHAIELAEAGLE